MTCDRDVSGPSALPSDVENAETVTMDTRGNAPETLTRAQCLDLLRTDGIARIAYSQRAMPAIVTVDYAVIDEGLVLRLAEGAPELASLRDAVVAFQADQGSPLDEHSWSVSCVGKARLIEDPGEALATAAAHDWPRTGATRPAFLRMDPDLLQGRIFQQLPMAGTHAVTAATAPAS
jgi:nitroimidazol reductase NimA-like FMN-containing flavoprotein (pyridoxamine 5'-phosphate oxidase superfamily)